MEINNQSEQYLTKQLSKLFHRLERILVPSNSIVNSNIGIKLGHLLNRIKDGEFFETSDDHHESLLRAKDENSSSSNVKHNDNTSITTLQRPRKRSERVAATNCSNNQKSEFIPHKVVWNHLEAVLTSLILEEIGIDSLPEKIKSEIDDERSAQEEVEIKSKAKMKVKLLQVRLICLFYYY